MPALLTGGPYRSLFLAGLALAGGLALVLLFWEASPPEAEDPLRLPLAPPAAAPQAARPFGAAPLQSRPTPEVEAPAATRVTEEDTPPGGRLSAARSQALTITGIVRDPLGRPLAGARVRTKVFSSALPYPPLGDYGSSLWDIFDAVPGSAPEDESAQSASDGRYRLSLDTPADEESFSFSLYAEHPDYYFSSAVRLTPQGRDSIEQDLQLRPAAQLHLLALDEGKPAAGLLIKVTANLGDGQALREILTDEEGRAQLSPLGAGRYLVEARRRPIAHHHLGQPGLSAGSAWGAGRALIPSPRAAVSELLDLSPGEVRQLVLPLPRVATVEGRVLHAGRAVPKARVTLHYRHEDPTTPRSHHIFPRGDAPRVHTDEQGYYRFDPVRAGAITLAADGPSQSARVRILRRLEPGEQALQNLMLESGVLRGRILAAHRRGPPSKTNTELFLLTADLEATAGDFDRQAAERFRISIEDSGHFTFAGLPSGVRIGLRVSGRDHVTKRLLLTPPHTGGDKDLGEITLAAAGSIELDLQRSFAESMQLLRIRRLPDQGALEASERQTQVFLPPRRWPLLIDGLAPGRYRIESAGVSREGAAHTQRIAEVMVLAGQSTRVER